MAKWACMRVRSELYRVSWVKEIMTDYACYLTFPPFSSPFFLLLFAWIVFVFKLSYRIGMESTRKKFSGVSPTSTSIRYVVWGAETIHKTLISRLSSDLTRHFTIVKHQKMKNGNNEKFSLRANWAIKLWLFLCLTATMMTAEMAHLEDGERFFFGWAENSSCECEQYTFPSSHGR